MFWTIVAALLFVFVGLPVAFYAVVWLVLAFFDSGHKPKPQPAIPGK